MDRSERVDDQEETLRLAFMSMQAGIWTSMPGIVQSCDATARTVLVAPALQGRSKNGLGVWSDMQMPLLYDCIIGWQGGGGVTATFPITNGDECLVIFASRCIDSWFANGGANNPMSTLRLHSLSDGFALVGIRSLPRKLAASTTAACLISDDGATYLELNPTAQTLVLTAPNGITLNGMTIDSSGNVSTPGNISSTAGAVNAKTKVTVNGTTVTVP